MNDSMNNDTLVIGLPSKGRLEANSLTYFARAGLGVVKQDGRGYNGRLQGVNNVEVVFLSADEIAQRLGNGGLHMGVTGEDLIYERIEKPELSVEPMARLGFGHATVAVAVPKSWIDVRLMVDLDEVAWGFRTRYGRQMRIATKYTRLTRNFLSRHGVTNYRIVESAGATEGAPGIGSAEFIVDITSTGATLAANNLKLLEDGVILKSEAVLMACLVASWSTPTLTAAAEVLAMIMARKRAASMVEVRFVHKGVDVGFLSSLTERFGVMTSFPREGTAQDVVIVYCPREQLHPLVAWLQKDGSQTVTASFPDYIFTADNEGYDRLLARLNG
ncbi:MAG: ATP phosphoribosyltransferase [Parvularculales bacterium]